MRPSFWRRIPGNWSYLLRIFVRRPEDDVDAELRFHFDERIAELTAQGTSRELARAKATEEFGDVDRVRERLHDIDRRLAQRRRRADWWEGATQDLRYVLRGLARSPGFTVMVVITLALGIGANAAIFSVLDRLFVQAPVGAPISFTTTGTLPTGITFAAHVEGTVRLGRGADAEKVMAVWVLGDHFGVLGVRPLIGRFFTAEESSVETFAPVAVISERLWKERFGGTPAALGQPLDLGAHRFTVIGVTPPGFRGVDIDVADVWLPEGTHTSWTDRKPNWYDEHLWTGAMRVLTRVARPAEARAFEAIAALSLKHTG